MCASTVIYIGPYLRSSSVARSGQASAERRVPTCPQCQVIDLLDLRPARRIGHGRTGAPPPQSRVEEILFALLIRNLGKSTVID